jgi:hypothetical protein
MVGTVLVADHRDRRNLAEGEQPTLATDGCEVLEVAGLAEPPRMRRKGGCVPQAPERQSPRGPRGPDRTDFQSRARSPAAQGCLWVFRPCRRSDQPVQAGGSEGGPMTEQRLLPRTVALAAIGRCVATDGAASAEAHARVLWRTGGTD